MGDFYAVPEWIIDGTARTVVEGALTSGWRNASELVGGQFFVVVESTGAATYTLAVHVSPVAPGDTSKAPADYYVAATVAAAGTAKAAAWHALPDIMQRPFMQYRVVITPAVEDASAIYVCLVKNGS